MSRSSWSAVAGAALLAATLLVSTAGARSKSFHFTEAVSGAQISATQAVFKVHDSRAGDGAGVQTVTLHGLSGTDTDTTYYLGASASSHGFFTIGSPDAHGIAKLTGHGRDTGGTGKLQGFASTYRYTGTFNVKTLVFTVTISGVGSTA